MTSTLWDWRIARTLGERLGVKSEGGAEVRGTRKAKVTVGHLNSACRSPGPVALGEVGSSPLLWAGQEGVFCPEPVTKTNLCGSCHSPDLEGGCPRHH